MRRKPDAMIAMVVLFCLGLAISGFSSISAGSDERRPPVEQKSVRY